MRDLVLWGWWLLACTHHAGFVLAQSQPDAVRGVNLGGWLLIEQWITPSLFRRSSAADEWSLCADLGKDACRSRLESHWSSFFTRDDFQTMRDVGLNSVRIPVGYWAVDVQEYEPYVSGQYPYLIQAVNWAQELGMSVLIDLHGAPGSQNGQDNSGLIGPVRFPDNSTNFDRSYAVLRNLSSEFSKPEYGGVVWGIQLLNEPRLSDSFPMATLKDFYTNGSAAVREGGSNQAVVMHDAFWGPRYWRDYDPANADASSSPSYITIDTHQYYAFAPLQNLPHDTIIESICNISQIVKATNQGLPSLIVGEWSLESGTAPDASDGTQHRGDSQAKRTWLRMFFEAQLAAYSANASGQPISGWYFWTWKTEYDIDTWSYRRGVEDGYIPADVSNRSTWTFPILDNGCIDASFNYTAPESADDGGSSGNPWYWGGAGRLGIDYTRWAVGFAAAAMSLTLYA